MFPFPHLHVLGPSAAQHACAVPTRWRRGSAAWLVIGSHPPRPRGFKARPWVQMLASSSLLCDMPLPASLSSPVMWVSSAHSLTTGCWGDKPKTGCHGPGGASPPGHRYPGGPHVERAHGLLSSESAGWANAGRGQGPGQGEGDRPRHWGWHGARVPCPLRVSSAPHFFLGVPACPQPWQEQISFRSGWLCRGQEEWVYCEDGRQRPKLNRPGLEGGAGPGQGVCVLVCVGGAVQVGQGPGASKAS